MSIHHSDFFPDRVAHELSGCLGKVAFTCKNDAAQAAKRMRRYHGSRFSEYKCKFCRKYHVGEPAE